MWHISSKLHLFKKALQEIVNQAIELLITHLRLPADTPDL